ncbi:hypothetical protein S83_053587 [Arachis hypogaea]
MKYPSVRGSNFIRFSILIHPSPNSNTLNEGTTPANRSSRISRSNEDCLARVACWSPEAAGRSGVSAFWPILSAPKVAFIPGKIELSSLVPTWSATINTGGEKLGYETKAFAIYDVMSLISIPFFFIFYT